MFLPVNIRRFCKQYFNFYCKWYIWKQLLRVFFLKQPFALSIIRKSLWGLISSRAAGCMSDVLVEVGSLVGVSQVFCLFYCLNGCLGGTTLGGCFIILGTLFIFILHGKKVFWRALFAGGFWINNWYCVGSLSSLRWQSRKVFFTDD